MATYSSIHTHHSMFFDDIRNNYYFDAIKNAVNKDSVVLDLGAGLGIHGLMALCGAKKVYLVEPAEIINTTRMIIEENNLSDKVECIEGKIEEIELPEKVDVIISVFTGNFLLFEDLLPSLFYARDKFLSNGGVLIPDRAKMLITPVSAAKYYSKYIDCWSNTLNDIDFNVVRQFATNSVYLDTPENRQIELLSEPIEILELSFMTATEAACRSNIKVKISNSGKLHGWLGWFDSLVGDKWLSTSPENQQMHWRQVFLPLEEPIIVNQGEIVSFELNRPQFGDWSWIVEVGGKRQKHSTFLSEPIMLSKIIKKSNNYRPKISEKGRMTYKILELFNQKLSIDNIIVKVKADYPDFFCSDEQVDKFIKNMVDEYT